MAWCPLSKNKYSVTQMVQLRAVESSEVEKMTKRQKFNKQSMFTLSLEAII